MTTPSPADVNARRTSATPDMTSGISTRASELTPQSNFRFANRANDWRISPSCAYPQSPSSIASCRARWTLGASAKSISATHEGRTSGPYLAHLEPRRLRSRTRDRSSKSNLTISSHCLWRPQEIRLKLCYSGPMVREPRIPGLGVASRLSGLRPEPCIQSATRNHVVDTGARRHRSQAAKYSWPPQFSPPLCLRSGLPCQSLDGETRALRTSTSGTPRVPRSADAAGRYRWLRPRSLRDYRQLDRSIR